VCWTDCLSLQDRTGSGWSSHEPGTTERPCQKDTQSLQHRNTHNTNTSRLSRRVHHGTYYRHSTRTSGTLVARRLPSASTVRPRIARATGAVHASLARRTLGCAAANRGTHGLGGGVPGACRHTHAQSSSQGMHFRTASAAYVLPAAVTTCCMAQADRQDAECEACQDNINHDFNVLRTSRLQCQGLHWSPRGSTPARCRTPPQCRSRIQAHTRSLLDRDLNTLHPWRPHCRRTALQPHDKDTTGEGTGHVHAACTMHGCNHPPAGHSTGLTAPLTQ
jgi:hypothetical protein